MKSKLKISYNDKLMFFEVDKKEQFPKDLYMKYLTMDDLGKLNKFFRQFDTPVEVLDSLQLIIKNSGISFLEENKQMKMEIINPFNQQKIYIDMQQKEKDLKTELN